MHVVVASDLGATAATHLAAAIRASIDVRGACVLALSGGRTPWAALRALADHAVPWERVTVVQVDERAAPEGHPDRNLVGLTAALPLAARIVPMPVDDPAGDAAYAAMLHERCGGVLDVVHLGLGDDGHTASLVPGDQALDATGLVAWTGEYQGRRRMTLTYPALNAARTVLWLASGASKRPVVERLLRADPSIPAGRVRAARATLLVDPAAAPG